MTQQDPKRRKLIETVGGTRFSFTAQLDAPHDPTFRLAARYKNPRGEFRVLESAAVIDRQSGNFDYSDDFIAVIHRSGASSGIGAVSRVGVSGLWGLAVLLGRITGWCMNVGLAVMLATMRGGIYGFALGITIFVFPFVAMASMLGGLSEVGGYVTFGIGALAACGVAAAVLRHREAKKTSAMLELLSESLSAGLIDFFDVDEELIGRVSLPTDHDHAIHKLHYLGGSGFGALVPGAGPVEIVSEGGFLHEGLDPERVRNFVAAHEGRFVLRRGFRMAGGRRIAGTVAAPEGDIFVAVYGEPAMA